MNRMMKDSNKATLTPVCCPRCSSSYIGIAEHVPPTEVFGGELFGGVVALCLHCRLLGGFADSADEAIRKWNMASVLGSEN